MNVDILQWTFHLGLLSTTLGNGTFQWKATFQMICFVVSSQEQAYAMATVEDLSPFAKITTRSFVTKITTYAHFRREKNKDFINKVYITVPCLPAKYQ